MQSSRVNSDLHEKANLVLEIHLTEFRCIGVMGAGMTVQQQVYDNVQATPTEKGETCASLQKQAGCPLCGYIYNLSQTSLYVTLYSQCNYFICCPAWWCNYFIYAFLSGGCNFFHVLSCLVVQLFYLLSCLVVQLFYMLSCLVVQLFSTCCPVWWYSQDVAIPSEFFFLTTARHY